MQQALTLVQNKSIKAVLIVSLEFEAARNVSRNMNDELRKVKFNEDPSQNNELEEINQAVAELREILSKLKPTYTVLW